MAAVGVDEAADFVHWLDGSVEVVLGHADWNCEEAWLTGIPDLLARGGVLERSEAQCFGGRDVFLVLFHVGHYGGVDNVLLSFVSAIPSYEGLYMCTYLRVNIVGNILDILHSEGVLNTMLRVPLRSTHPLIHVADVVANTFLEILWAGHVLLANVRGVLSGRCTVSAGLDGFEVFGAGDPDFL